MGCINDTQIMIADGSKRRISDLRIGDIVKTEGRYSKITNIYRGREESLIEIKTITGISIQLTNDHVVMSDNGWKEVSKLKVGDTLCTDGGYDKIESTEYVSGGEVYDFEIEPEGTGIYANDIVIGYFSISNSFELRTNSYINKSTGSINDMLIEIKKLSEDLNR